MEKHVSGSAVSVSGLSKHFGRTMAADGLDFEVRRGTVFALLGPNGAGKTTTVSIMEGLLRRDSGDVAILGADPWADHDLVKSRIGVMPQGFNFFENINPFDAVKFYCDLFGSASDPDSLLSLVGLENSKKTPFQKLSGGQKQKLGLALSLVNDPELLFLDEPTTGLDPSSRRGIWNIIREFKRQGKTIVLTTHYMEEAEQLADDIAIINRGKIVSRGSPDEIIAKHGRGRKLVVSAGPEMLDYLRSSNLDVFGEGRSISVQLNGTSGLISLIGIIENSGIPYSQLTVRTDSLEDVFISLVGEMAEGELK